MSSWIASGEPIANRRAGHLHVECPERVVNLRQLVERESKDCSSNLRSEIHAKVVHRSSPEIARAKVDLRVWLTSFGWQAIRLLVLHPEELPRRVSSVSDPATWTAKLLPTTSGINAMIKFNQMGSRLSEAAPELLNLAVLVLLYGGLILWRYRPTLGRQQS